MILRPISTVSPNCQNQARALLESTWNDTTAFDLADKTASFVGLIDTIVVAVGLVETCRDGLEVTYAIVDSKWRHQRHGTQLMRAIQSNAGTKSLTLTSDMHTSQFYTKLGFQCIALAPDGRVCMRWDAQNCSLRRTRALPRGLPRALPRGLLRALPRGEVGLGERPFGDA